MHAGVCASLAHSGLRAHSGPLAATASGAAKVRRTECGYARYPMRKSHRCPKCNVGPVLHISPVDSQPEGMCIAAPAETLVGKTLGIMHNRDKKPYRSKLLPTGTVTAYVCRGCGYTEFYTENPGDIYADGTTVKELGNPGSGPYR